MPCLLSQQQTKIEKNVVFSIHLQNCFGAVSTCDFLFVVFFQKTNTHSKNTCPETDLLRSPQNVKTTLGEKAPQCFQCDDWNRNSNLSHFFLCVKTKCPDEILPKSPQPNLNSGKQCKLVPREKLQHHLVVCSETASKFWPPKMLLLFCH